MVDQVLRFSRSAMAGKIARRPDGPELGLRQPARDQARVLQRPDADRHIYGFLDKIDVKVRQGDGELERRIRGTECTQQRDDFQASERTRKVNAQSSGRLRARLAQHLLRFTKVRKNLPATLQKRGPVLGQVDASR